MRTIHSLKLLCLGLLPVVFCANALAQSYSIDWYKIAGGGGMNSTGGVYSVSGTIGQHDAGGPMTGGNYSLTGGFWALFAVQTPGAPVLNITLTGTATVTCTATDACGNSPTPCISNFSAQCAGGEGCTPGFWKQPQHFGFWPAPYTPSTQFSAVFENAFPGKTLLQVLSLQGGGLNALGRHTVAALLNAASANVNYNLTPQQVIDMFNAVFPGGDYETLKNLFEQYNSQNCPIGNPHSIGL